jgi:O-antigen/teichoic acid export membrane protein
MASLSGSKLTVNVVSGPLLRAAGAALTMAAYPAYLHWLGAERYGLWLVLSTVLMLSQLGGLGVGEALTKVVAEEHARGGVLAIRQYSTAAAAALAGFGGGACLALFVWRHPITHALGLAATDAALARDLLPYCGAVSAYVLLADTQTNVLAGLGRIDLVNGLQLLSQAIAIGGGLALLRAGYGLGGLLAAAFVSRGVQHALAVFLVAKALRAPVLSLAPMSRERLRHLASLSSGLCAGGAVSLLLNPLNRIVVARFAGVQSVPVYEIAYNGAMQLRSLLLAGVRALLPEVSRLSAGPAARRAISCLTGRAASMLFATGAPLYIAVFAASGPVLRLWLHGSVQAGQQDAFRIMLAGSFLSLLGTVPYYSLLGLHRGRQVLYGYVAQSAANVAGISLLWQSSSLKVAGVLWATSAGMAASTLYLAWAHRHAVRSIA